MQKETPGGTQYYAYDSRNLLSFIRYKDATTQYFHHDAQGLMHAMDDNGTLTYFVWDKNGMNLLMERDSDGNVTADYSHGYAAIDGSGSYTGGYLREGATTDEHYPFHNHHGDRMVILDQSGAVTGKYLWNAWGKTLFAQEPSLRNRFGWQENWIRLKEGHYISRARVYDEEIGRFAQRDPILKTIPLYHYGSENANVYVDPTGLWEVGGTPWRGGGKAPFVGTVTCGQGDTFKSLALLITGEASDAMLLIGEPKSGNEIDIAPLLTILDIRLRQQVVKAAKLPKRQLFGVPDPVDAWRLTPAFLDRFFNSDLGVETDCKTAIMYVYGQALLNEIGEEDYRGIGFGARTPPQGTGVLIPFIHPSDVVSPEELELGDSTWFLNWPNPVNPAWGKEHVIKVGSDQYYAFPLGEKVTSAGIESKMREKHGGVIQGAFPGLQLKHVTFLDVVDIARKVFAYRKGLPKKGN